MASLARFRHELVSHVTPVLPERLRNKVVPEQYAWSYRQLLRVAAAETRSSQVRLLIAPANSASQGLYWSQAASTLEGVYAQNLAFTSASDTIVAQPNTSVHEDVGRYSHIWARRQRKAIMRDFTHVLYEAERPILGGLYHGDVQEEIRDLLAGGIKVAMVSHGSDVRTPSTHRQLEPFSPFFSDLEGLTETLELRSAQNHRVLSSFDVPKYVSTPDLLKYVPDAKWLPTLTNAALWEDLPSAQIGRRKLVVLHVPSRSALKGTDSIRKAMRILDAEGLIHYMEAERVPYKDMPALVASADVVVDQVSMGLYGIASVEAMLAGRIAVAQAGSFIRDSVKAETGWDLPIVEATPQTVGDVVADIARNPGAYLHLITKGKAYANAVHSPGRAAEVFRTFLT